MEVHLVGVEHEHQWCNAEETLESPLAKYLIAYHERTPVSLIAEEFSEDALKGSKVESPNGSVAWSVSTYLNIKHAFCDPDSETRKKLGIPTSSEIEKTLGFKKFYKDTPESKDLKEKEQMKYWGIRENYWLSELLKINAQNVLFLVGKKHVQRFKLLLEENSILVVIANAIL